MNTNLTINMKRNAQVAPQKLKAYRLKDFSIRIAKSPKDRIKIYSAIGQRYAKKGLSTDPDWRKQVTPYDADPNTLILLAEDHRGNFLGTISLIFDSPKGLPCDCDFKIEADRLRTKGRKLIEVSRFVIKPSKPKVQIGVLRTLINFIFIHAQDVMHYTDFVIEVHPKHVGFYQKSMLFQILGSERSCKRVNNEPAILLRFPLTIYKEISSRMESGGLLNNDRFKRTFFRNFAHRPEANRIETFLRTAYGSSGL